MNPRHAWLFATLLVSLPLVVAGCGNKGPLVLAEEPAPIEAPAMPAGTVPVEIEPQTTLPEDEPAETLPDPTAVDPLLDAEDEPPSGQDFPIDPATVPDSPPPTGTADDGNG